MNGPKHYREAERIAAACMSREQADLEGFTGWGRGDLAALAQVHATLAQAAATMDVAGATSNGVVSAGWGEVLR